MCGFYVMVFRSPWAHHTDLLDLNADSSTWHLCDLASYFNSLGLRLVVWAIDTIIVATWRLNETSSLERLVQYLAHSHLWLLWLSIIKIGQLWSPRLARQERWAVEVCVSLPIFSLSHSDGILGLLPLAAPAPTQSKKQEVTNVKWAPSMY